MDIRKRIETSAGPWREGFSLTEAVVCIGIFGVLMGGLLTGVVTVVSSLQYSREQTRATQIMAEKLEQIRLYSWESMADPSILSRTFQVAYGGSGSGTNVNGETLGGWVYQGTIQIQDNPVAESYRAELRKVTVRLQWQSKNRTVQSQMSSFVAKHGTQSFYAY